MKTASALLLVLMLSACAGTGGPAMRHASLVDEHPDFTNCVALVQASWASDAASRAERLQSCLSRPQVAQTDL
ncbi:hypothetical protein [Indioceanicola profundi]|uniref:hypothetical protein n=1 Tax=Indioceanicola profundi TaxID=2220096 RepID=UPI000E6AD3B3|nr:hypothetical protein [Indioceanicola profundi]